MTNDFEICGCDGAFEELGLLGFARFFIAFAWLSLNFH